MIARRSSLLAVVACVAIASACASEEAPPVSPAGPGGASGPAEPPPPPSEVQAPCEAPRIYFVALRTGACAEVTGAGGLWSPRPVFPGGPAEVQRFACAYRWSSPSGAAPDGAALAAALSGGSAAIVPICGPEATFEAVRSDAAEIAALSISTGMAGSVGCDVCGFVWEDKLWAIISPEQVVQRELEIPLVGRTTKKAFRLTPSPARAIVVDLPAAPSPYAEGFVTLY